jgi:hypothetical protein
LWLSSMEAMRPRSMPSLVGTHTGVPICNQGGRAASGEPASGEPAANWCRRHGVRLQVRRRRPAAAAAPRSSAAPWRCPPPRPRPPRWGPSC